MPCHCVLPVMVSTLPFAAILRPDVDGVDQVAVGAQLPDLVVGRKYKSKHFYAERSAFNRLHLGINEQSVAVAELGALECQKGTNISAIHIVERGRERYFE